MTNYYPVPLPGTTNPSPPSALGQIITTQAQRLRIGTLGDSVTQYNWQYYNAVTNASGAADFEFSSPFIRPVA